MPVEVINVQKDLPKATRNRHSVLEDTKEWTYVVTKLSHGLKPNEALRVVLPKDTMKKLKHAPRLFKMLVERYIQSMKMDYSVFTRGTTDEGTPVLYIANLDKRFT